MTITHTILGVKSIKNKTAALGVSASKYQLDTIANWPLRLCLAYPKDSAWKTENPTSKQKNKNKLYECYVGLPIKRFIRRVVVASYADVYLDEYQDCSDFQHLLVSALAEFLLSRIFGDPMQAILTLAKASL